MKLSAEVLLLAAVDASHFRAISYNIIQGGPNQVQVSRTQTWRRGNSGYSGGCTAADVSAQIPSQPKGDEECWQKGPVGWINCGYLPSAYIVTDVEDSLDYSNNYCYGYKQDAMAKPTGPYEMEWGDCCWVSFKNDAGVSVSGGSYGFLATVNDVNNNAPQVKIPPMWKVMAGCPAQTLALNPVDLDNDKVKCRFARSNEALGAYHGNHDFSSITLDEDTCILTYDGTQDLTTYGVKPIAIQVEDYDQAGQVRSSMPVQFLATVWTPSSSSFNNRELAMHGPGRVFQFPALFPIDDDGDDDSGRRRRSGSLPSYCSAVPTLVSPSPAAGSVISVTPSGVTINLKATSNNGAITRFQYNSPIGMSCTGVTRAGEVTCRFTPSSAQMNQAHNFCFLAEDAAGMSTNRRCVTLTTGVTVTNRNAPSLDIFAMINHVIPSMAGDFENYGCAGVGEFDHFSTNVGIPIDDVDLALHKWRLCMRCAQKSINLDIVPYDFDEINNMCGKT